MSDERSARRIQFTPALCRAANDEAGRSPAVGTVSDSAIGLLVALGIGLLLGVERERRKGRGRGPAGVRTFALVALLEGLSYRVGGVGRHRGGTWDRRTGRGGVCDL